MTRPRPNQIVSAVLPYRGLVLVVALVPVPVFTPAEPEAAPVAVPLTPAFAAPPALTFAPVEAPTPVLADAGPTFAEVPPLALA